MWESLTQASQVEVSEMKKEIATLQAKLDETVTGLGLISKTIENLY